MTALLLWLGSFHPSINAEPDADADGAYTYRIGVGIADITGPAAEINMMGYAKLGQDTSGIHFRLRSRTFLVQDQEGARVLYINNDLAMVDQAVTTRVLQLLATEYGAQVYNSSNVMLSATHTHSGPGGFLQYLLYTLTAKGFVHQNFDLICDGIVRSVRKAHDRITEGRIYFNEGTKLISLRFPNGKINSDKKAKAENEKKRKKVSTNRFSHQLIACFFPFLVWFDDSTGRKKQKQK